MTTKSGLMVYGIVEKVRGEREKRGDERVRGVCDDGGCVGFGRNLLILHYANTLLDRLAGDTILFYALHKCKMYRVSHLPCFFVGSYKKQFSDGSL